MIETPIYSSLINYIGENNLRLHMPGHIGKPHGLVSELQSIASLDLTEVPGIDDLHLPSGAIKQGMELLAEAFGASESIFLVNGATSGIQALFLALAIEGKKILVPRNSHRSLYGGFVLSGLWPAYLDGEIEYNSGLTVGVSPRKVIQALDKDPDIIGVFLTSPSYYGTTLQLKEISEFCKENGVALLVDEAHGSHFPFHPELPAPALEGGADAVVNGLHKTLPVLNQGACLHIAASCSFAQEIKTAVSLITTTSPSFPILASIDMARSFMEEDGEYLLGQALKISYEYKNKINAIKGLRCMSTEFKDIEGVEDVDPLKVLVFIDKLSINGYDLAHILRQDYKIQVELAEESTILAMFSIFHGENDWAKFYRALENIARQYYNNQADKAKITGESILPLPQVAMSPRQAHFSKKRTVRLKDSLGLIAGEMVAAYPPGIPALLPGELITRQVLDYLYYLQANKIGIQGPQDKDLFYISIIE